MKVFYELHGPDAPPTRPQHWSFSGLTEWHACPKRWWLSRAAYPNAATPYPQGVGVAAIEGQLVHHALEHFADHVLSARGRGVRDYGQIRETFLARRVIQEQLTSVVRAELDSNPRVDAGLLLSKVSIDACVNAFKTAASRCLSRLFAAAGEAVDRGTPSQAGMGGAEVWVEVQQPPLCGKLDLFLDGAVYDFKTGEPDSSHVDQVRFYALLVWLKTGRRPKELVVFYARNQGVEVVPVPEGSDLLAMRERYASQVAEIHRIFENRAPIAKASVENCRYCPVRQLCDEYWVSGVTASLRCGEAADAEPDEYGGTRWGDLEVEALPEISSNGGCVGYAQSRDLGRVRLSIDPRRCPSRGTRPAMARLLSSRVRSAEDGWHVEVGSTTEVFWGADARGR